VASEFADLPLEERMKAYHAHAVEALKAAEASESRAAREHFLFIAIQWEELAKQIESSLLEKK
jgi:hypothetical protein